MGAKSNAFTNCCLVEGLHSGFHKQISKYFSLEDIIVTYLSSALSFHTQTLGQKKIPPIKLSSLYPATVAQNWDSQRFLWILVTEWWVLSKFKFLDCKSKSLTVSGGWISFCEFLIAVRLLHKHRFLSSSFFFEIKKNVIYRLDISWSLPLYKSNFLNFKSLRWIITKFAFKWTHCLSVEQ